MAATTAAGRRQSFAASLPRVKWPGSIRLPGSAMSSDVLQNTPSNELKNSCPIAGSQSPCRPVLIHPTIGRAGGHAPEGFIVCLLCFIQFNSSGKPILEIDDIWPRAQVPPNLRKGSTRERGENRGGTREGPDHTPAPNPSPVARARSSATRRTGFITRATEEAFAGRSRQHPAEGPAKGTLLSVTAPRTNSATT